MHVAKSATVHSKCKLLFQLRRERVKLKSSDIALISTFVTIPLCSDVVDFLTEEREKGIVGGIMGQRATDEESDGHLWLFGNPPLTNGRSGVKHKQQNYGLGLRKTCYMTS